MNNKSSQKCVTSSAFLSEAVKLAVYKTPAVILDYVEKHKHQNIDRVVGDFESRNKKQLS